MLSRALPALALALLALAPGCNSLKGCLSGDEPAAEVAPTVASPDEEAPADDAVVTGWAVFLAVDRTEGGLFRIPEEMLQDALGERNINYAKVTSDDPYPVTGPDGAVVSTLDVGALATRPAGWIFAMEGKDPTYLEPGPIPRVLSVASEYFGVPIDPPADGAGEQTRARKAGKTKVDPEMLKKMQERKDAKGGKAGGAGKLGKFGGAGPGTRMGAGAALYGEAADDGAGEGAGEGADESVSEEKTP